MRYQECLEWLYSQLPMYQRQGKAAYKADLTNTIALAKHLKNPELQFKSIHVGGTNGKGSVSHLLASVFQEAGYKVGLYTSPHLIDFRERIKINGKMIPKQQVISFVEGHHEFMKAQQLSFFEMTVGLAFSYFASQKVDIAIIEVGMGGRLDSTNIIQPELSVITNISLDHTAFLGHTISAIAEEKAGIIKYKTPVVIGEFHLESYPVFEAKANSKIAPIYLANQDISQPHPAHLITYQRKNLNTLKKSLEVLKKDYNLTDQVIQNGISKYKENTGLNGRWQVIQQKPKVICDTGHNLAGIQLIVDEIKTANFKQLHIVFGMVNDKDVENILRLLPKTAFYYFCEPSISRALSSEIIFNNASEIGLQSQRFITVREAYQAALTIAQAEDLVFVGGSTFVVADLLTYLFKK